jgi:hypothetical protein
VLSCLVLLCFTIECCCAEYRFSECHDYLNVMLSIIILNVVMLSVIILNVGLLNVVMLSVVMLNVVAPIGRLNKLGTNCQGSDYSFQLD